MTDQQSGSGSGSYSNGIQRSLGRIEGQLAGVEKALKSNKESMQELEQRLRHIEVSAAKYGGVTGTIASILVSMIVISLRSVVGK
jgi:CII-binding regulator of phage lambda lysogenization HflD